MSKANLVEQLRMRGMNYAANQIQPTSPSNNIVEAFEWAKTPEGYKFWAYVAGKLGEQLTTGAGYYPL